MHDTLNKSAIDALERLARESKSRPVWIRVGQLIDGTSITPARDAHIVFDAKQIRYTGAEAKAAASAVGRSTPDLELPNHTVLPTLIEAHSHAFLEGAPIDFQQREQHLKQPAGQMLKVARARQHKLLQCGIGAIRDAGDKHHVGLTLSRESKLQSDQLRTTPYIDSPGAAIHHKGRYGSFMGEPIEDHESLERCVSSRVTDGADRIKLLVSGIIDFKAGQVTTPPQMTIDEVKAIVAAARTHGKQTFAHASGAEGIENSIEGRVNTVEHGFFITPDQLAKMRDRQIAWVPTFAPVQLQIDRAKELGWDDQVVINLKKIIDAHRAMLVKAQEMGVTIVAGSDAGSCGVAHGIGFLAELAQMESAGMTSMNVLRAATGISAATLDFPEKIGQLVPGFRARMIFTPHDPLQTVANLSRSKTILFDGAAIDCPDAIDLHGL